MASYDNYITGSNFNYDSGTIITRSKQDFNLSRLLYLKLPHLKSAQNLMFDTKCLKDVIFCKDARTLKEEIFF